MASLKDAPIDLETGTPPAAAVIWLHGLGADGNDFVPIVPELGLSSELRVRFVFPHAPMRPVTINGGYIMRAWYDLAVRRDEFFQDADHIAESVGLLHDLIERECARGIPASRIVVAGFSQGGAIALHGALRFPRSLAGAVILSAPAPFMEELLREAPAANANLPIFLAHGIYDQVVPAAYSQHAAALLKARNQPLEWHAYPIEHSVNLEEIRDIGRFLTRVLA